jgi:hypothetical protein
MRTDSILTALKAEGHLDDLMIAMTEAVDADRANVGLALCEKLGFKTSRTSISDGYRRHFFAWQLNLASSMSKETARLSES